MSARIHPTTLILRCRAGKAGTASEAGMTIIDVGPEAPHAA
jgi:hypothetical protein